MSRPRPRIHLGKRRIIRRQRPLRAVKLVNQNFIKAEIIHHREPVIRRQINRMRMRPFLPLRIRPMPSVLHKAGRLAQSAIRRHRKYRDAPAGVIRHQNIFPRLDRE